MATYANPTNRVQTSLENIYGRNNVKHRIAWEKLKLPDEVTREELAKLKKSKDDEEDDEDSLYTYPEEDDGDSHPIFMGTDAHPFLQLRSFNFWTAHCDFRLTSNILKIVNDCDGVESVNIVSPYRFHISVGKLFNVTEVRADIETKIRLHLQKTK